MWDMDLPVLPGSPHADVERRLLEEWLRNPFLDEDVHLLEQRLGTGQAELRQAIDNLCRDGVIKGAGARGYMLDAGVATPAHQSGGDAESPASATAQVEEFASAVSLLTAAAAEFDVEFDVEEANSARKAGSAAPAHPAIDMSGGLAALFPGADVSAQSLIESLPFGIVVLRASGALEMANTRGAQWLGISLADVDGATFELATGVDPLAAVGGHPVSFSLHGPVAVEVGLYPAMLESGDAVLAVLRDVSLQEEVSRLQGEVQEELFSLLNKEMVGPLNQIEQFLNHPDARALAQARGAMEQINWFLRDFYLRGNPGTDPDEDEPPCQI